MNFKKLMLAAAIAAPLMMAEAAHAQVRFDVHVGTPPPPPRVVAVPAERPGYIWAPGFWEWRGNRHVWRDGHYERNRPGYHYVAPAWDRDGERYGFRRGHWDRG